MSRWARFLLWLLDHTTLVNEIADVDETDIHVSRRLEVDWLEYCWSINSDNLFTGDSTPKRNPPGDQL